MQTNSVLSFVIELRELLRFPSPKEIQEASERIFPELVQIEQAPNPQERERTVRSLESRLIAQRIVDAIA